MEKYTRAGVPGATDGSYIFRIDDSTQVSNSQTVRFRVRNG